MALTLTATAGHASANTYLTVTDANTYHEGHLYASTWNDATLTQKEQALVWATRILDSQCLWVGVIASDTQALRWPRVSAYDRDGRLLANDTIPDAVEQATAELARHLITADRTAPESTERAVKRVKAGGVEVEFVNGTSPTALVIPDAVFDLIRHLTESRFGAITVRRA